MKVPSACHLRRWFPSGRGEQPSKAPLLVTLQGMEKGVKDFAQNVEQLVDRVVSGDLALELTQHADKMVSGFIRGFEARPPCLVCSFRLHLLLEAQSRHLTRSFGHCITPMPCNQQSENRLRFPCAVKQAASFAVYSCDCTQWQLKTASCHVSWTDHTCAKQDGYSKLENAVRTTITRNLRPRRPKQQRKLKATAG